jgi:hypothetical protein
VSRIFAGLAYAAVMTAIDVGLCVLVAWLIGQITGEDIGLACLLVGTLAQIHYRQMNPRPTREVT